MKTHLKFYFILFFVGFSLRSKAQSVKNVTINTDAKTVAYTTDLFNIDKYLVLRTDEQSNFNYAKSIKIRHDTIFVFERSRVLVWAPNGGFVCSLGKAESACKIVKNTGFVDPMSTEMILPSDFDLVPGKSELAVWDNVRKCLFIYDFKGNLKNIKDIGIESTSFAWTRFNQLIFDAGEHILDGEKNYYAFEATDLDGKVMKKMLPFGEDDKLAVGSFSLFPTYNGKQFLHRAWDYVLYEYSRDGELKPYLKVQFDKRGLTPDVIHQFKGDTYKLVQYAQQEKYNTLESILEGGQFYQIDWDKSITGFCTTIVVKKTGAQYCIQHRPQNLDPLQIEGQLIPFDNFFLTVVKPSEIRERLKHTLPLVKQQQAETVKLLEKILADAGPGDSPVVLFLSLKDSCLKK